MRRGTEGIHRGPRIRPVDPAAFTLEGNSPPRKRIGKKRRLTPEQFAELIAWWKARRALLSRKQKAAQLGISTETLRNYLRRALNGDTRGRDE